MLLIWITLISGLFFALITLGAMAGGMILYRPGIFAEPPRDVLILAAHQDDCVIMAGEYAIIAKEAGRQVRVVYLTNGDSGNVDSSSERARIRNQEAAAAWGSIGVAAIENLGLPAASIVGPTKINGQQTAGAIEAIAQIIRAVPGGTAVFIPAAGETHPDHQLLREISLQALRSVQRSDLAMFEAPEYNPYVSLARMPLKALEYIAKGIPRVRRWVCEVQLRRLPSAGFPSGTRPYVLPPDSDRLERKRRLLSQFESEGGERLVRLFGNPDLFRRIHDVDHALRERPRGYLPLGVQRVGISIVCALLCICSVTFLIAVLLVRAIAASGLLGSWHS
jgi:LmbE family N-acetylglucosaminyl deacetylase